MWEKTVLAWYEVNVFAWNDRKNNKTLICVTGLWFDIETQDFPDLKQECCPLVCSVWSLFLTNEGVKKRVRIWKEQKNVEMGLIYLALWMKEWMNEWINQSINQSINQVKLPQMSLEMKQKGKRPKIIFFIRHHWQLRFWKLWSQHVIKNITNVCRLCDI
jgi:hypothetical protein